MKRGVWAVRPGRGYAAHALFRDRACIALGWWEIGDLSRLAPSREDFKVAVAETYPDAKPGAVSGNAGQLYRFVHRMMAGDLVMSPSPDRTIHVGRIEGAYRYEPERSPYPQIRPVAWLLTTSRNHWSRHACSALTCKMTVFSMQPFSEEVEAALDRLPAARKNPADSRPPGSSHLNQRPKPPAPTQYR